MKPKKLDKKEFLEVLDRTPLVSIDLVIRDPENRILLGRRINEPAKGKWFVPGGRIMKNESLEEAFDRITENEIGIKHNISEARLLGVFAHHYDTNFYEEEGITTQYIALAYELNLNDDKKPQKKEQHSEYEWIGTNILDQEKSQNQINRISKYDIHKYTLVYFGLPSNMTEPQYQILNSRRDSFNNLVWQTPVLSLTAQAFLFTIILTGGVPKIGRIIAAILSLVAALMSLHLLYKHRFMEKSIAISLQAYEDMNKRYSLNRKTDTPNRILKCSSYLLWMILLGIFLLASVGSLVLIGLGILDC